MCFFNLEGEDSLMKTHSQMKERLKWYVGKYIDWDKVFQAQCMDLAVDYMYWATDKKYRMWGNAIDAVNDRVNNYGQYATVYKNTKNFLPQVGDIAVWTKPPAHPQYGHIGIVYGDINLNTCTMLDQNWDGDPSKPAKLRTDDYRGVTHFVRINFKDESIPTKPSTNTSASGNHTVKKGETLYSISKAYKMPVDELKKINNLKSNTIHPGDKLKTKKSTTVTPPKKPAAAKPKTPRTIGSWQVNKINGAQYIRAEGTFTVGSEPIMSRFDNPSIDHNNEGGWAKPGSKYKYQYLVRANGYVWIQYELNGRQKFLPYNTWNSKTGEVGKNEWGSFS